MIETEISSFIALYFTSGVGMRLKTGTAFLVAALTSSLFWAPDARATYTSATTSRVALALVSDLAIMHKQEPLVAFTSWYESLPGVRAEGYVASVYDVPAGTITLLWHGQSPLQRKIVEAGAAKGIPTSVRPWAHSLDEIEAIVDSMWHVAQNDAASMGFVPSDIVQIDPENPVIRLRGNWSPAASVTPLAQRASAMASLRSLLRVTAAQRVSANAPLPDVDIEDGWSSMPATTRSTDIHPFNAAGYMISPSDGSVCTSGFAVNYNGATHTTTARHCTKNDYQARNGTDVYGATSANSSAGARVLSSTGYHWNFDGAWNDSTGYHKTVDGLSSPGVGGFVCVSGGNSGVHCNIKITGTSSWNDGFGSFSTVVGVQQTSGAIAAIEGDSGGTVFTLNGTTGVLASGMIQGITGTQLSGSACGSVHDLGKNKCSATVFWSGESDILNSLGATLVT